MPTYKHNDYYGYINDIVERGISDPAWFWSENASEARQWLYNNDASQVVDEIYRNTPEDIQKNIPTNYLSPNLQSTRYMNDVRKRNDEAGKNVVTAAATVAGAPSLIAGAVAAPAATALGLLGGATVGKMWANVGSSIGNDILSRNTSDELGASISTNQQAGAMLGGIAGGIAGGVAGGLTPTAARQAANNIKWLNQKNWMDPDWLGRIFAPEDVVQMSEDWAPKNYQILLDRARHAIAKPKFKLALRNTEYDAGSLLGSGSESKVYDNLINPNTVLKVQTKGAITTPSLQEGNVTGSTIQSAIEKGKYLAKIKSQGSYTVPQKLVGLEQQPKTGRYAPMFEQPRMSLIMGDEPNVSYTPKQARRILTTYAATRPVYTDVHFKNMAFDGKNAWLIDNQKISNLNDINNFTQTAPEPFSLNGWLDKLRNNSLTLQVRP